MRLSDRREAAELAEFLRARAGAIVNYIDETELEVSLLGSYSEAALQAELDAAIRRWTLAPISE